MIPRYQKILFSGLVASIVLMAFFLFYERQRVRDQWSAKLDETPLRAPGIAAATAVTLDLASDSNGTIAAVQRDISLPEEPSMRAGTLLSRLLAEYASPRSDHPLAEGAAIDDVFFLHSKLLSSKLRASRSISSLQDRSVRAQEMDMAVVNLRESFVAQHPSGAETEMLTILSLLGTFHTNFPEVAQILFIVNGRSRDTLAGHVDLIRAYAAVDTTIGSADLQPAP